MKLLSALIDLDNNLRAGVLTESELVKKTETSLTPLEVKEALKWLIRPDVRLVTPRAKGDEQGFELAHERIIAAIRNIANKALSDVDLANQLLSRRTSEWVGNNRSSSYLLNSYELRSILKQKSYLSWELHREQKENLIRLSQRRYQNQKYTMAVLLFIGLIIYGINYLPEVQIWKVKRELLVLSEVERPTAIQQDLAIAFFEAGMPEKAILVSGKIKDPKGQSETFQSLSKIAVELKEPGKAAELLDYAIAAAKAITDDGEKAETLLSLSKIVELKEPGKAAELLDYAITAAKAITNDWQKAETLLSLSKIAVELKEPGKAAELLDYAIAAAKAITDDGEKAKTLLSLSKRAAGSIYNLEIKKASGDYSAYKEIIGQLLHETFKIPPHEEKRDLILIDLSRIIAEFGDWSESRDIVNNQIKSESNQMIAFIGILKTWTAKQSEQ